MHNIFNAYDIRGIIDEDLTTTVFKQIAYGIAIAAKQQNQNTIAIARDGRNCSEEYLSALSEGLAESGINVIDLGMTPASLLYYAAVTKTNGNGLMVTAGHHPANFNGLKIMLGSQLYHGEKLDSLKQQVISGEHQSGEGIVTPLDIKQEYLDNISLDVVLAHPMKVVIDAANGVAGDIASILFERLGCSVSSLFSKIDGDFPDHQPDPSRPENLMALVEEVQKQKADLGIAFDSGGNRFGIVASNGEIIWTDRVMMLLARDILARNEGATIIYDVKSSKLLKTFIAKHQGNPLMCGSGYPVLQAKLQESGALLAGEFNGHIIIKERWHDFDDAFYAVARVIEILSNEEAVSSEIFARLPNSLNTPEILIPVDNKRNIMYQLMLNTSVFSSLQVIPTDGLRVEYPNGWGLIRASNSSENLTMRFEADNEEALQHIAEEFKQALHAVAPGIKLPF